MPPKFASNDIAGHFPSGPTSRPPERSWDVEPEPVSDFRGYTFCEFLAPDRKAFTPCRLSLKTCLDSFLDKE
jgi:hypothetical protein